MRRWEGIKNTPYEILKELMGYIIQPPYSLRCHTHTCSSMPSPSTPSLQPTRSSQSPTPSVLTTLAYATEPLGFRQVPKPVVQPSLTIPTCTPPVTTHGSLLCCIQHLYLALHPKCSSRVHPCMSPWPPDPWLLHNPPEIAKGPTVSALAYSGHPCLFCNQPWVFYWNLPYLKPPTGPFWAASNPGPARLPTSFWPSHSCLLPNQLALLWVPHPLLWLSLVFRACKSFLHDL